jgi:hypothetical protein
MAKKRFDFRMAVGTPTGPRSNVWHFWSRNNQVYATHADMGGVQKFSFHTPNVCRLAFTKEHGIPAQMDDRAMHEWRRDPTPQPGNKQVVRVLRVGFATSVLSTALKPAEKDVNWVPAAPAGGSTVIDLMFTRETEGIVREAVQADHNSRHEILAYKMLPHGEAFCLASWFDEKTTEALRVPASHGQQHDLIILRTDPTFSGRPVRLTTYSNPKDGDFMQAWEFGGYWFNRLTDQQWDVMHRSLA